jgi:hypothetical protein
MSTHLLRFEALSRVRAAAAKAFALGRASRRQPGERLTRADDTEETQLVGEEVGREHRPEYRAVLLDALK